MNTLALKMLFGDTSKYLMLISGIVFATILMTQGMALFCGLLTWMYATLSNVRVPVWVCDPMVEQVNDNKPLRETEIQRVRSVSGCAWAVPFFQGLQQVRLADGSSKLVTLLGIDDATFIGAPEKLVEGNLEDLRLPNTVIVDEFALERLKTSDGRAIRLGDSFEINDREARVVGVCRAVRSFTGGPFVYTTYHRALQYVPSTRKMLSFILAGPVPGVGSEDLVVRIREGLGLGAFTYDQMRWSTIRWYFANTGIPINVGTIVIIGFIIGTAITAQTFFAFVVENSRHLAALMAMGTTNLRLCAMLILQSLLVGTLGFGIGQGAVSLLGMFLLRLGKVPFLLVWQIPCLVYAAIVVICLFSALLGIARIARLEPAVVFR